MSDFSVNLSQYELAKTLHYGCSAIANYESGRNEPSIDSLIRLAEALDITVDELVGVKPNSDELHLISTFKKLDNHKKQIVLSLIDVFQSQ